MSILTIDDLKARSIVDPATHCWHWQGAKSSDRSGRNPRMHTFDHDRGEKRTMGGAKAVWNIAHQCGCGNQIPFRGCLVNDCVNPAHVRLARDKAAIGEHIRRSGKRKGQAVEQRRANQKKAIAALGLVPTPDAIVLAIRAAPATITGLALASQFGIAQQTVSAIRTGKSHRHLLPTQPTSLQAL